MPDDYLPYVYLIKNESLEGIYSILLDILSKSKEELHEFGNNAKEFVLLNKNNLIQGKKITEFIDTINS